MGRLTFDAADDTGDLAMCAVDGLGRLGRADVGDVPAWTRLVALPFEGPPTLTVEAAPFVPSAYAALAAGPVAGAAATRERAPAAFGGPVVRVGEPHIWRGLRVVEVQVRPVRHDPVTELVSTTPLVRFRLAPPPDAAPPAVQAYPARQVAGLRRTIANFDALERRGLLTPRVRVPDARDRQIRAAATGAELATGATRENPDFGTLTEGFREAFVDGHAPLLGELVDRMERSAYYALGGTGSSTARFILETYVLLGDPALPLRTEGEDLLGQWRFEEANPQVAYDTSGWRRDLRAEPDGTPLAYDAGPVGRALDLRSGTVHLEPVFVPPATPDALTVSLWLHPSFGSAGWAVARGDCGAAVQWGLSVDAAAGELRVHLRDEAGALQTYALPYDAVEWWRHVAFTYDGADAEPLRVYADGWLMHAFAAPSTLPADAAPIRVGARGCGGEDRFDGLLDEVRVYGRALSAGEIAGIAHGADPSLVAHYPMWATPHPTDGDMSNPWFRQEDVSGRGNHLVVTVQDDVGSVFPGLLDWATTFHGPLTLLAPDDESMAPRDGLAAEVWLDVQPSLSGEIVSKAGEYSLTVFGDTLVAEVAGCPGAATAPLPAPTGWHHVAFSYASFQGELVLSIDGREASVVSCTADPRDHDTTWPLRVAYDLYGAIDDLRVYRRPLDPVEIGWRARLGPTALYLPLDGDAPEEDRSGWRHEGFVQGTVAPAVGIGGAPGSATQFDGGGDLAIVDHPALALRGLDFTISAWVLPDVVGGGAGDVVTCGDGRGRWGLRFLPPPDDGWIGCDIGPATWVAPAPPPGAWAHVACAYDRARDDVVLYVDGVAAATYDVTPGYPVECADPVVVGEGFRGRIDDLRVEQRAWTAADAARVANAQGSGPLVGDWRFDDADPSAGFVDASPYATPVTDTLGETCQAPSFDGLAYVAQTGRDHAESAEPPAAWDSGAGVGADFWLHVPCDAQGSLLAEADDWRLALAGGAGDALEPRAPLTNHGLRVEVRDDPPVGFSTTWRTVPRNVRFGAHDRWVHLALSYDPAGGTVDVYQDGARVFSSDVSRPLPGGEGVLRLLGGPAGQPGFETAIGARIDRLRRWGRALTPGEVRALYDASHFRGRWRFDEAALPDDGPLGLAAVARGDAAVVFDDTWQGGALALDGAGDWAEIPYHAAFANLADHFTLGVRVRPETGGYVVAQGSAADSPFVLAFDDTTDTLAVTLHGADESSLTATTPFDDFGGAWHDVQVVFDRNRASGHLRVFLDAGEAPDPPVPAISEDFPVALRPTTDPLTVGRATGDPGGMLAGRVDDLHVTSLPLDDDDLRRQRASRVADFDLTALSAPDRSPFARELSLDGGATVDVANGWLRFDTWNAYAEILAHDVDADLARAVTLEFELQVDGLSRCNLVSLDGFDWSRWPALWVRVTGGSLDPRNLSVRIGGDEYALTAVDLRDYWGQTVGVRVRFDAARPGDNLELTLRTPDGQNRSATFHAQPWRGWAGGNIRIGYQWYDQRYEGGSAGRLFQGTDAAPRRVRCLRLERRWAGPDATTWVPCTSYGW